MNCRALCCNPRTREKQNKNKQTKKNTTTTREREREREREGEGEGTFLVNQLSLFSGIAISSHAIFIQWYSYFLACVPFNSSSFFFFFFTLRSSGVPIPLFQVKAQATVAQRPETKVEGRSLTSYLWTRFLDRFPYNAWTAYLAQSDFVCQELCAFSCMLHPIIFTFGTMTGVFYMPLR